MDAQGVGGRAALGPPGPDQVVGAHHCAKVLDQDAAKVPLYRRQQHPPPTVGKATVLVDARQRPVSSSPAPDGSQTSGDVGIVGGEPNPVLFAVAPIGRIRTRLDEE
ncbi:MAG: hypothetical protein ACR2LJ_04625 [Acidimicrobiales bacterium]